MGRGSALCLSLPAWARGTLGSLDGSRGRPPAPALRGHTPARDLHGPRRAAALCDRPGAGAARRRGRRRVAARPCAPGVQLRRGEPERSAPGHLRPPAQAPLPGPSRRRRLGAGPRRSGGGRGCAAGPPLLQRRRSGDQHHDARHPVRTPARPVGEPRGDRGDQPRPPGGRGGPRARRSAGERHRRGAREGGAREAPSRRGDRAPAGVSDRGPRAPRAGHAARARRRVRAAGDGASRARAAGRPGVVDGVVCLWAMGRGWLSEAW